MLMRCTNPPSARGSSYWRRAAGLLTRGSLSHRLPGSRDPVAWWRESVSPYSGGTVPDLHRSSLTARRCCGGNLASLFVPGSALALDLDGVLADTRPLWDAWLEDAAPRARVGVAVPGGRESACGVLR